MDRIKKYFSAELTFWIIALIYLAAVQPGQTHFSFCLFNHLGISWCPGCGIGHSISYLLHGEIQKSFQTHILGTFALFVMVYRIIQLIFIKKPFKNQNYGQSFLKS